MTENGVRLPSTKAAPFLFRRWAAQREQDS
jgi:hypothetical protein